MPRHRVGQHRLSVARSLTLLRDDGAVTGAWGLLLPVAVAVGLLTGSVGIATGSRRLRADPVVPVTRMLASSTARVGERYGPDPSNDTFTFILVRRHRPIRRCDLTAALYVIATWSAQTSYGRRVRPRAERGAALRPTPHPRSSS
jgi:hypothetical protein